MAKATIKLELEPAEFDLLRETLAEKQQEVADKCRRRWHDPPAEARRFNRELSMRLTDLLTRLK